REVAEELEQGTRDVAGVHDTFDESTLALELDVERAHPEDAEPDHREQHGQTEDTADELADGAASRDASDEDTDEGRPGDGPRPVEDGPSVLPARVGEGVVPERQTRQGLGVDPGRLDHALEQEQTRSGDD